MVKDPAIFEIDNLDDDIKEHFMNDLKGIYIPKLPTLIQIERHLRCLLDKCYYCQNCSDNSKDAQNNI